MSGDEADSAKKYIERLKAKVGVTAVVKKVEPEGPAPPEENGEENGEERKMEIGDDGQADDDAADPGDPADAEPEPEPEPRSPSPGVEGDAKDNDTKWKPSTRSSSSPRRKRSRSRDRERERDPKKHRRESDRDRDRDRDRRTSDRRGGSDRRRSRSRERHGSGRHGGRDERRSDHRRSRERRSDRRRSRSKSPAPRKRSRSRSRSRDRDRDRDRDRRKRSWSGPKEKKPSIFSAQGPMVLQGMNMQEVMKLAMGGLDTGLPGMGIPVVSVAAQEQAQATANILASAKGGAGHVTSLQTAEQQRKACNVHISPIAVGITEKDLVDFFNAAMNSLGCNLAPGNSVISATNINYERSYAFLQFRSADEATCGMALDGIVMKGVSLKIRRPKDYVAPEGGDPSQAGSLSASVVKTEVIKIMPVVPEGPHKLYFGGIPSYFTDDQVKEILQAFGPLKAFSLVMDTKTQVQNRGFGFCQYNDPEVTEIALAGLDEMEIAPNKNMVLLCYDEEGTQRDPSYEMARELAKNPDQAKPPSPKAPPPEASLQVKQILGLAPKDPEIPELPSEADSPVLQLSNIVTDEDIKDDEAIEEVTEDLKEQCEKFGTVVALQIPKKGEAGAGKAYVEFSEISEATKAAKDLHSRLFDDRIVTVVYYPHELFQDGMFE